MNIACKNCNNHRYVPKDDKYTGIGMHWCDKYNNAIREIKMCEIRKKYKKQE